MEKVTEMVITASAFIQMGCHALLDLVGPPVERLRDLVGGNKLELNWTTPKGIMNVNLLCQLVTSAAFLISSMYVSQTENAGFGVLITALLYVGFALCGFVVVNKKQDAIFIGLVLGMGIILTFFSVLTAIFWGELSQCEVVSRKISKYSCREELKAAMRSVSLFATFMFLLQMSFTTLLFYWRTNLLSEQHQYSELPYGSSESDEPMFVRTGGSPVKVNPKQQISTNKADFETLV